MNYLYKLWEKIVSVILTAYINFVYKSSSVMKDENFNLLTTDNKEKIIILFWHGDSFCLYPILKGQKLDIVTTRDRRGDYITSMSNTFGYKTIRLPDESEQGKFLFKIKKQINDEDNANLAIAVDGPLGPYHTPKIFPFVLARYTRREIIPININVKRKVELKFRWDNYKIPLPFNKIKIIVNEPIKITKKDSDERFLSIKDNVKTIMEKN